MKYENVTVFGGGNAAFAMAACMSLKGRKVTLCDFPEFAASIEPVRKAGNIKLVRDPGDDTGSMEGLAKIHCVTTDLRQAVEGADLVAVCAQAHAHGRFGREAAPYLRDGQHVLLLPGSCFGAMEFRRAYAQAGGCAKILLGESNTLTFAARKTDQPNEARIKVWATEVFVAALPASDTAGILEPFHELFPQCIAAADTLETCLLNLNPYVHSAPAVLSISAVELANNQFLHYMQGITPSTAKVMIDLDRERIDVCKALGYRDWNVAKIFYRAGYLSQLTGDWVADMQSKPVLRTAKGPFNIKYRYYTEDTGVGLSVVHSIGRRLSIPMPTHHSLVHLTGVMNQIDYFADCSRSLEALGIDDDASTLKARF